MSHENLKFNKQFFSDFWRLFKPYWTSEEKWSAFGYFAMNIFCVVVGVRGAVALNGFQKEFYDALQNFNKPALLSALLHFVIIVTVLLLAYGYVSYFNGVLSARWRRWLTRHYTEKWLHNHTHYRMQLLRQTVDNPDQRISEDLDRFPEITLSVFFTAFQSLLLLVSFGFILWNLSAELTISLGNFSLKIPGYLFWAALLYAILGTFIMNCIGKKLAGLDYQQQFFNADLRFSLVRLRESSEQVAMYQGEGAEHKKFGEFINRIFKNIIQLVSLKKYLNFFTSGYNTLANLLGILLALPFYLEKKFQMGTLVQIATAFDSVVNAFSMFINGFSLFAEWKAVVFRLTEFTRTIESANRAAVSSKITIFEGDQNDIIVQNLKLSLPDGKLLLDGVHLVLEGGNTFLLTGRSGIGKSTFLRALAGFWPYGEGQIQIPKGKQLFFLPQKPYLPLGSLKEVLLYPGKTAVDEEVFRKTLRLCQLEKFQGKLEETKHWVQELSLGEQQLIAFARIFLNKPDIIFLDEATSALDEKTESEVYQALRQALPQATIISVGHRSSLYLFHERHINLKPENQPTIELAMV